MECHEPDDAEVLLEHVVLGKLVEEDAFGHGDDLQPARRPALRDLFESSNGVGSQVGALEDDLRCPLNAQVSSACLVVDEAHQLACRIERQLARQRSLLEERALG